MYSVFWPTCAYHIISKPQVTPTPLALPRRTSRGWARHFFETFLLTPTGARSEIIKSQHPIESEPSDWDGMPKPTNTASARQSIQKARERGSQTDFLHTHYPRYSLLLLLLLLPTPGHGHGHSTSESSLKHIVSHL